MQLDLSGTVRDAHGRPVSGCSVSLVGIGAAAQTSQAGSYRIRGEFPVALAPARGLASRARDPASYFRADGRRSFPSRSGLFAPAAGRGSHAGPERPAALAKAAAGIDSIRFRCAGHLDQVLDVPRDSAVIDAVVSPLWDLVVYGGTSAGIIAAVQAVKMGKTAVVVSPDRRLGGLTTGGLGETDIGNKAAIGGLSLNFYQRVAAKYARDSAWTQQTRASFSRFSAGSMWVFEPKVALELFHDLVREHNLPVVKGERLELNGGVARQGARIQRIRMESGLAFWGRMFLDATYEGDLMAKAGVSYAVGREPNSRYNETLNGIQTALAAKNQLPAGIDPYVVKGNPASGLLPGVNANAGGADGAGDLKVQAYCFRMTLTDATANRIAVPRPADYDERRYELLFRAIEAGQTGGFFKFSAMPNRKTDSNNEGGISTDYIGQNYAYPEGDYATREQIIRAHASWQMGLVWTLANHARVPSAIRNVYAAWGLPRDEFGENGNWSPQLYIRESRRMIGQMVMTQRHVTQVLRVTASVGLGAYTMDSHHVQRHVSGGQVRNEGDVQVGGFGPYPIDYGSIVPRASECENLLVPVCLSASHIAYGSIRMEPVFMILAQSAATAAALALDAGVAVQNVDYAALAQRLLQDGQILGPQGLVVDDADAALTGTWTVGNSSLPFLGSGYRHDGNANKGGATAAFNANLPSAGRYEVCFHYPSHANRAGNVPVVLTTSAGPRNFTVNQQAPADTGFSLGVFDFGTTARLSVSNAGTNGYVVIDAVRFIRR